LPLPINQEDRIRAAWQGRISGCMLGKAVELFSMREGPQALNDYLHATNSLPLRDYIPYKQELASKHIDKHCCAENLTYSRPDDDINYTALALLMLEKFGKALTTADVARSWMKFLPVASTYTAERAAYKTLLSNAHEWFPEGKDPGFDLALCANNVYSDWIGAQIRADLYGWVCPGNADLAVKLATADAQLSHQGDGVYGAVLVAALGALIPRFCSADSASDQPLEQALDQALSYIPEDSKCAKAVHFARQLASDPEGTIHIKERYKTLSVVHTVNNLALVVWALLRHQDDFSAAIGDVVAAGLDTDCNGATVGALWALQGKPIPAQWIQPWQGRVGLSLAGFDQMHIDELVARTIKVAKAMDLNQ
jgi:ADP-ribosylglycohydrolase